MKSPEQKILDLVRVLPAVDVQNRLMTVTDGDFAVAMLYMKDHERERLLGFVSTEKARRVREELRRNEHVRILYTQYEISAGTVIRILSGSRGVQATKRYFRPRR